MNKFELVEQVVEKTGYTRKEVEEILEACLKDITANLLKGDVVKLTDFGTFSVRERQARNGTNPKTGVKISISASKSIGFKASKKIRAKL